MSQSCELCTGDGGEVLWRDTQCRVIQVADPAFPGFCRVIWNQHVAEMTDLAPGERGHFMNVVWATEAALRAQLRPTKINLASLGNVVPHLHWHVIPRFVDDSHFPNPIWGSARRDGVARAAPDVTLLRQALQAALASPGA